ncbi:MAG: hypothetical protein K0S44_623 [Bacteroidetes bacterium]|jgi:hypothetical protein|nr:hypothetical protein [Bacteroidota bacterium]
MKALLIAFSFLPVFCLAQAAKTTAKPSTTDCPTFVNKPQSSKAASFEAMRHTKKAKPAAAPKAKTETAYVPSFSSSSDKVMDKKPTVKPAPSEKTVPAEKETPEAVSKTKEPAVSKEKTEEGDKAVAEKKVPKKKKLVNNSGKVQKTKTDPSKCPAF